MNMRKKFCEFPPWPVVEIFILISNKNDTVTLTYLTHIYL